MTGLGYRQKRILELIDGRSEVRVGYLIRGSGADGKTVHVALRGLEQRGLVRRVQHGVWGLQDAA